ncbi:MAG: c-type cytochrome, partial [Verrucomicrobia bacterium]|nr:c-type cytochrome [Verrucomicrobiota bacterium]
YKAQLSSAVLARADKSQGRLVFNNTCAACHTLYGEGGKIGPDITGGNRHSLDYLLDKVSDPSAQIPADFRYSIAKLKDGRSLTGVVATQTDRTTTLKTMAGPVTIAQSEIQSIEQSTLSLMPEGLFEALTADQVRDLVAYLMDTTQTPLPGK